MPGQPVEVQDVPHAGVRVPKSEEVGGMLILEHCQWKAIDVAFYLGAGICVRVELANYDEPEDGQPEPAVDGTFFGPPPHEGDRFPTVSTAELTGKNKYSKCVCGVVSLGFHLNSSDGKKATIRWWRDCAPEGN